MINVQKEKESADEQQKMYGVERELQPQTAD